LLLAAALSAPGADMRKVIRTAETSAERGFDCARTLGSTNRFQL